MTNPKEIIKKYNEFAEYLNSINLKEVLENHSIEDIKLMNDKMSQIYFRRIEFEVREYINQPKNICPPIQTVVTNEQKFKQLIQKIGYLSDQEKVNLYEFLIMLCEGETIAGLTRITRNAHKTNQIEKYLVEHGIADKYSIAICPGCSEHLTIPLSEELKKEYQKEIAENYYKHYCPECYNFLQYDDVENLDYKEYLVKK
ncbi:MULTISPECIES: hypothetical protein [Bacillus cereus group]|uniref:Uncharacterized protein n=1 Tax=Bacillus cereus (strain G9842) TaxID=405531 RepID=B7IZ42_BACC2|nr:MULTISPECIES: hypothetical protein [Bacillus cereus group]ACK98504.1 hypothetical protein BCG9842_0019 [Bacillus cereus G9842]MDR4137571.1 hypothetical protein [Bacillus cereus]MDR4367761.1 hypothetical protein [Bacillus cereus]PEE63227.1 hypothetical protein COM74_19125 [Bacillus thuringiensis]